ncbi:unnamed protein product [Closterium sp. NIES-54]
MRAPLPCCMCQVAAQGQQGGRPVPELNDVESVGEERERSLVSHGRVGATFGQGGGEGHGITGVNQTGGGAGGGGGEAGAGGGGRGGGRGGSKHKEGRARAAGGIAAGGAAGGGVPDVTVDGRDYYGGSGDVVSEGRGEEEEGERGRKDKKNDRKDKRKKKKEKEEKDKEKEKEKEKGKGKGKGRAKGKGKDKQGQEEGEDGEDRIEMLADGKVVAGIASAGGDGDNGSILVGTGGIAGTGATGAGGGGDRGSAEGVSFGGTAMGALAGDTGGAGAGNGQGAGWRNEGIGTGDEQGAASGDEFFSDKDVPDVWSDFESKLALDGRKAASRNVLPGDSPSALSFGPSAVAALPNGLGDLDERVREERAREERAREEERVRELLAAQEKALKESHAREIEGVKARVEREVHERVMAEVEEVEARVQQEVQEREALEEQQRVRAEEHQREVWELQCSAEEMRQQHEQLMAELQVGWGAEEMRQQHEQLMAELQVCEAQVYGGERELPCNTEDMRQQDQQVWKKDQTISWYLKPSALPVPVFSPLSLPPQELRQLRYGGEEVERQRREVERERAEVVRLRKGMAESVFQKQQWALDMQEMDKIKKEVSRGESLSAFPASRTLHSLMSFETSDFRPQAIFALLSRLPSRAAILIVPPHHPFPKRTQQLNELRARERELQKQLQIGSGSSSEITALKQVRVLVLCCTAGLLLAWC